MSNQGETGSPANYSYKYPRPAVTVDTVLFTVMEDLLKVLLIRRKNKPFTRAWALPGGFINMDEDLHSAALRELSEETGVDANTHMHVEQLHTYGAPDRDPRGRTITVAYIALLCKDTLSRLRIRGADDAEEAAWWEMDDLPELAFDHANIVSDALIHLRSKINYSVHPFMLLPAEFTLTELQTVYVATLGQPIDKRNFRRKILSSGAIVSTGRNRVGAHRPAKLYRYAGERLMQQ